MMKKTITRALAAAALAGLALAAQAQYPAQNPTYVPTAVFASTTVSATGTASVQVPTNGLETLYVRIGGSPTNLNANMQGTESRGDSPSWTNLPVTNVATGALQTSMTAAGLYRLNASGLGQVRVSTTVLTGTFGISMSGGLGATGVRTAPASRYTYSSGTSTMAPASAATDIVALSGNASNTVRVTYVQCTGQGSATSATSVGLVKYSVASTGGTSVTQTITALDSASPASASSVRVYTANPSAGTAAGTLAVQRLVTSAAASPTFAAPAAWQFGPGRSSYEQEVTLRGAAEQLVISGGGNTFTGGTTINCTFTWTEE